jgi:hypothetical protein
MAYFELLAFFPYSLTDELHPVKLFVDSLALG